MFFGNHLVFNILFYFFIEHFEDRVHKLSDIHQPHSILSRLISAQLNGRNLENNLPLDDVPRDFANDQHIPPDQPFLIGEVHFQEHQVVNPISQVVDGEKNTTELNGMLFFIG